MQKWLNVMWLLGEFGFCAAKQVSYQKGWLTHYSCFQVLCYKCLLYCCNLHAGLSLNECRTVWF